MLRIGDERFMNILTRAVGHDRAAVAAKAFAGPPSVSIRLNPSKTSEDFAETRFGPEAENVPWSRFGYVLKERPQFTLDPLFHAGCYYVQDSSAMYVGQVFRNVLPRFDGLGRPVRVLDLCAAPGGKTTDMAASLRVRYGDGFVLAANEVMRGRASVLADNVAVWGDPNVTVTNVDPKAFARFGGFFDIIVADVPCSGEGMFRKDPKALEDWSEDTVKLCASRQRRIIADVWPALSTGGVLIYSTCTFEDAENDANVEWIADDLGADVIEPQMYDGLVKSRTGALLVPGLVKGEGQFAAALVKTSDSGHGDTDLTSLRPLRNGLVDGTVKGKDFIPSADLALAIGFREGTLRHIHKFDYQSVEVDREMALRFLRRDSIFIGGKPTGFLLICFEGHPLGFVKNLGTRWNNLHPQGRRIRMDID